MIEKPFYTTEYPLSFYWHVISVSPFAWHKSRCLLPDVGMDNACSAAISPRGMHSTTTQHRERLLEYKSSCLTVDTLVFVRLPTNCCIRRIITRSDLSFLTPAPLTFVSPIYIRSNRPDLAVVRSLLADCTRLIPQITTTTTTSRPLG